MVNKNSKAVIFAEICICTLFAALIPENNTKIILISISIVLFGILLNRIVLFSIVGFFVFVGGIVIPHQVNNSGLNWAFTKNIQINNNSFKQNDNLQQHVYPNSTVPINKTLKIYLSGAEISFNPEKDSIYYPDELYLSNNGEEILVKNNNTSMFNRKSKIYHIEIGTKNSFDYIELNGSGLKLSGSIKGVNTMKVDGSGIKFEGYIVANTITANGSGIKFDIETKNLNDMYINGSGAKCDIKYLDIWENTRTIYMNGSGTKLNIQIPVGNNGKLETPGDAKVNIERY